MSENFRKIKKKYMTVAIVAACILGVCLGVALSCALAVVFKTCGVNVHWAIYIPVALVLSAGSACLFFFILKPNDKRIAKKLDKDFALNQKVQTMVEFAHIESEMHELQREQTDEALGEVAKKRVDLKWLLKFAFVPVIAAAMLFAGIFVPAKKSAAVDRPYDFTTTHKAALKNLIEDVNGSSLDAGLKTFFVFELDGLLGMLQDAEYESAMKSSVIKAVRNIDNHVADTNSYLKISAALKNNPLCDGFATAVVNSVVDYKNSTVLTYMNAVKEKEKTVDDDVAAVLTRWKTSYVEELDGDDDRAITLMNFADAITAGIQDEELVKAFAPQSGEDVTAAFRSADGDAFYKLVSALGENLYKHAEAVLKGEAAFAAASFFDNFITDSKTALGKQSYNCMMDEFVRNSLARIFGISRGELGSNLHVAPYPTQESGGNERPPEQSGDGGGSDGIHIYGSNDEILDPDTGEKKKYGDYINPDRPDEGTFHDRYSKWAVDFIASTDCTPEMAAFIRNYFEYLAKNQENQT